MLEKKENIAAAAMAVNFRRKCAKRGAVAVVSAFMRNAANIAALVCAAVISALAIFGYVKWKKSNTKPKPESTPAPITETAAPTGDVPNTP